MPRHALQHIAYHDGSHDYAYSWGYTMFRTVYTPGSEEAVAEAVERLATYARYWTRDEMFTAGRHVQVDTRPNDDLWSRYHSEVVQDEQTLANVSETEVGQRFDAWIAQHRRPATATDASHKLNSRFLFCLMLDQESIDNILALPEDPRAPIDHGVPKNGEGKGWVKVITDDSMPEGKGGGRWWLRVGITDFLWPLCFFPSEPNMMLEELGWHDAEDGVQNLWGKPWDWVREEITEAHY
ncbi:hypothetical protein ACHAQH_007274 [Verticillium albo-atrum]